ncbi:MAG: 50S ribosomal protein L1 [Deltaproteobacteria bacterium]|nr:50S ribosomal protein L1 [Candidatus Anaeroferrophillacea bacterium]
MAKRGKRYTDIRGRVELLKKYALPEGFALARELAIAKFDETVDVAIRLGVDPRQADQMVRGAVLLPHGTGKTARVIAFAKGEKEKEARDAGADEVGAEDLAQRITDGWLDFDKAVATPDLMGVVGKLGRILGPRGLMPNPKVGTVTFDIGRAVSELKAGKVEFRVEKAGIIHAPVGRASFAVEQLEENARALIEVLNRLKPSSSKGVYMRSMTVSSTMGPGIDIDLASLKE